MHEKSHYLRMLPQLIKSFLYRFKEHVTENEFQRHVSIDAINSHHHEISQQHSHSHQDNYYEHFVGYDVLKSAALAHLLKGISILDWSKEYVYLMVSRIFKPPKK